jgi:hypothetical protein
MVESIVKTVVIEGSKTNSGSVCASADEAEGREDGSVTVLVSPRMEQVCSLCMTV